MLNIKAEILKAVIAEPPQKVAPPTDKPVPTFASATEGVIKLLLAEAGEPKSSDAKKLETLNAEWLAHLDDCKGYSHNDARRVWRQQRADYISKKTKDVPDAGEEVLRKFAERRRLLKQGAITVSEAACEIAAQCYERSLKVVPALRARIVAQEQAIFGDTAALGKSPLLAMVDDLPRTINARIESLRVKGANRRPSELLPKL